MWASVQWFDIFQIEVERQTEAVVQYVGNESTSLEDLNIVKRLLAHHPLSLRQCCIKIDDCYQMQANETPRYSQI